MSEFSPHLSGFSARSPLDPVRQRIADDICFWLRQKFPDAPVLRQCAEGAVGDLQHSIRLESLPEMATQLAMFRLADLAMTRTLAMHERC